MEVGSRPRPAGRPLDSSADVRQPGAGAASITISSASREFPWLWPRWARLLRLQVNLELGGRGRVAHVHERHAELIMRLGVIRVRGNGRLDYSPRFGILPPFHGLAPWLNIASRHCRRRPFQRILAADSIAFALAARASSTSGSRCKRSQAVVHLRVSGLISIAFLYRFSLVVITSSATPVSDVVVAVEQFAFSSAVCVNAILINRGCRRGWRRRPLRGLLDLRVLRSGLGRGATAGTARRVGVTSAPAAILTLIEVRLTSACLFGGDFAHQARVRFCTNSPFLSVLVSGKRRLEPSASMRLSRLQWVCLSRLSRPQTIPVDWARRATSSQHKKYSAAPPATEAGRSIGGPWNLPGKRGNSRIRAGLP